MLSPVDCVDNNEYAFPAVCVMRALTYPNVPRTSMESFQELSAFGGISGGVRRRSPQRLAFFHQLAGLVESRPLRQSKSLSVLAIRSFRARAVGQSIAQFSRAAEALLGACDGWRMRPCGTSALHTSVTFYTDDLHVSALHLTQVDALAAIKPRVDRPGPRAEHHEA
jgi:hypothetical protein